MPRPSLFVSALLPALLLAGCATRPHAPRREVPHVPVVPARTATNSPADFATACARLADYPDIPKELLWFRTSAEQRAAFTQAYRLAAANLETYAAGRSAGTWAVIADADETLIDNSPYECELELRGLKKSDPALFAQWVEARKAAALPGAAEFAARVHALGGRLIVVSNRDEMPHLQGTVDTLAADGIVADAVLLSKGRDDRNKTLRYDRVRSEGVPEKHIPPQEVLMWLGDNISDFPSLTQAQPGDLAEFGHRYILLSNPMYGSFEGNRLR